MIFKSKICTKPVSFCHFQENTKLFLKLFDRFKFIEDERQESKKYTKLFRHIIEVGQNTEAPI